MQQQKHGAVERHTKGSSAHRSLFAGSFSLVCIDRYPTTVLDAAARTVTEWSDLNTWYSDHLLCCLLTIGFMGKKKKHSPLVFHFLLFWLGAKEVGRRCYCCCCCCCFSKRTFTQGSLNWYACKQVTCLKYFWSLFCFTLYALILVVRQASHFLFQSQGSHWSCSSVHPVC